LVVPRLSLDIKEFSFNRMTEWWGESSNPAETRYVRPSDEAPQLLTYMKSMTTASNLQDALICSCVYQMVLPPGSKMSLTSLPTELLYQIVETVFRVSRSDIEPFSRTSARLHYIAKPLILEHRRLLRTYAVTKVTNAGAAKILYEICEKPWIALYIISLEMIANRNETLLGRPRNKKQAASIEEVTSQRSKVTDQDLEDLIRTTRLIPESQTPSFVTEIGRGNEDHLFALMLACLPNLERLTISTDSNKLEAVKEVARAIHATWSTRPSLPHVRSVHVSERDGSRGTCDLELFPLLAAIPGVQHLHGANLVGMYRECYRDGWNTYPGAASSLTHLSLETCGMSVEGLEILLASLKNLRSFKYIAHRAGWGLHALSTILKPAHASLETLELSTGSGHARYIGSLRQFTALKKVNVDTDMLFKNSRMQRAVDILPASIETLTIAGNNMTRRLEDEFLAELYRPSFYYPALRNIWAEDSWGRRDIGKERLKFQREFHLQRKVDGVAGANAGGWMLRYR